MEILIWWKGNCHPKNKCQRFGSYTPPFLSHLGISTYRKFKFSKILIIFINIFCLFSISYACIIGKFFCLTAGLHIHVYFLKFKTARRRQKNWGNFSTHKDFIFLGGVFDFSGISPSPEFPKIWEFHPTPPEKTLKMFLGN